MTVRQVESGVDSYELEEWAAYFSIVNEKSKPQLSTDEMKDKLKSAFAGAKAKAQRIKRR